MHCLQTTGSVPLQLQLHAAGLKSITASLQLDTSEWKAHYLRANIHRALQLFDLAVVDLRAALQHAISKVDGANMAEVEKLRVELEEGERRAVEAKSVPKDYYQVLGEQYSVLVRQSVGLVLHQV